MSGCVFFGSCTSKYTSFQKASPFASGKQLTLKTSLEPALRKLLRGISRNMPAPCVAYAGSLSFARLTLKTSLEWTLRKFRHYSSCHTLSHCVFFGACTYEYIPFQKASRFASGKRLTLQTSIYLTRRKFRRDVSWNTVSSLRFCSVTYFCVRSRRKIRRLLVSDATNALNFVRPGFEEIRALPSCPTSD